MTISHASDQATEGAAMPHPGRNPVDTGLPDAVSAFLEEASELDDLLSRLPEEDLAKQTPFSNWRVEDVVRHFIALERMAYLAIVDEAAFALSRDELIEWTSTPTPDEPAINPNFSRLRRLHAHKLGDIPRARLIGAWRESREMLASAAANTGDRKIAWFGPPMPLSRLFVSRQMEIWAYGQDVFDTFRIHRINGRRLCNVVDFGIRTRGFAFAVNGIPLPEAPHIALLAPSGHVWHWGDPLSPERISGAAEEFALVVTQRRNIADTGLEVTGEGAAQWMRIAQTIAGAPVTPPAPGERAWEASGEGNAPALPHAATVPALVHHLSRRFGSLPQIVDSMGAASFRDMEQRSRRIARGLLARGVPKGARIGVFMPNSADWVAAMLAIQRIGCMAVLVSTLARGRELAHIIRHSDTHMLLAADSALGHDLLDRLEDAFPSLSESRATHPLMLEEAPFLRAIHVWGGEVRKWAGTAADLEHAGERFPDRLFEAAEAQIVPADPALMIYTSGSQAEPKAVVHSQGNLVRQSHRMSAYMTYRAGDRMVTTMPLFWVGGLVTGLLAANCQGAALVCPKSPGAEDIIEQIQVGGATHLTLWAAQFAAVAACDSEGSVLRMLRPNSAQQLGLFGQASADRTPNSLGMTETLGPHSMEYYGYALPSDRIGSFGRGVGFIERAIVDPDSGVRLPPGATGEIIVRGGHMMLGMHRVERHELFTPDGWYRTGDIGRIDAAGHLYFVERRGESVKSAGANISPREVELALAAIEGIQEAVALGLPDPVAGEALVAVIVRQTGSTIQAETIKGMLRQDLSSYKIPKKIFFMDESALPRTPSGKVRKKELREIIISDFSILHSLNV